MTRRRHHRKTATLSNRLWVAKKLVTPEHRSAFQYLIQSRVFDELFGCFIIEDQEVCAYRERGTKVGFHCGNLEKIQKTFRGFTIYDQRAAPKLPLKGRQLKVRLTLRPEQRAAVRSWCKKGYGIIFAAVRWGKSIAAVEAAFRLGLRTIMMVDKISLAQQWLDEIYQHTNLRKVERKLGRRLAGVVAGSLKSGALRKLEQFPPLTFTTFQSISSLLKRRKQWMKTQRDKFGLVIVDECFVAGTRILMADGSEKSIELMAIGDQVWTPAGPRLVITTMHRRGSIFKVVASDGGDVTCTANHPFATVNNGWVLGGQLDGSQEIIRYTARPDATSNHFANVVATDKWLPKPTTTHIPFDYLPPLNRGRFFDPLVGPDVDVYRDMPFAEDACRLPGGNTVSGTVCRACAVALGQEAEVYNMEVEDVHMYVANGFLVANCHHSPAYTYADAIAFFNAAHRLGVTGSITRRDGKQQVMHDLMGPVTGVGTQEQMPCTVYLQFPDVNLNPNASWSTMISNLARSFPLMDAVVEQVIEDAERGRVVLVHSERNAHLEAMCRMVRRLAPDLHANFIHQKIKVPRRKELVKLMERGKVKVLFVGNVFMEGMTIKRADCIHLFPTTTNAETVKQRVGRVRTTMEGKPRPLVRLWCLGGHRGIFAGRAVHLKYFRERPHDFRLSGGVLPDQTETKQKLQRREQKAARTCGLCARFIKCRSRTGKRSQSTVCKHFDEHRLSSQRQLQWLVHYRERLNDYGRKMIDSFHQQDVKRLSDEQRRLLHDIFLDVLNSPHTIKLPAKS